jgi:hypothetical protein
LDKKKKKKAQAKFQNSKTRFFLRDLRKGGILEAQDGGHLLEIDGAVVAFQARVEQRHDLVVHHVGNAVSFRHGRLKIQSRAVLRLRYLGNGKVKSPLKNDFEGLVWARCLDVEEEEEDDDECGGDKD